MQELYQDVLLDAIRFLSDYSKKDEIWDQKKGVSQTVQHMYAEELEFKRLAARMNECGISLGFSESVTADTGEIGYKLKTARFCHVRNCPTCSWRRTMSNKHRFYKALPALVERCPTHRFLFLTLTVVNCDISELRVTLSEMGKAWKRLIKRKEFSLVTGWARTTEVTQSDCKKGNAHPHFHAMLMVKPSYFSHGYVKQEAWLKAWQEATRDPSITQVDIRAMRGEKAVKEVLKYAVKEADLVKSSPWLFELTRQTHGLRFIATGGLLKDVLKEEMTDKEMIVGDDPSDDKPEEEVSLLASWMPSVKRYKAKHV